MNTPGSFICSCAPGYQPRPTMVTSFDPTASGTNEPTDGDENCVNVNECDSSDYECSEKEICSDTEGGNNLTTYGYLKA